MDAFSDDQVERFPLPSGESSHQSLVEVARARMYGDGMRIDWWFECSACQEQAMSRGAIESVLCTQVSSVSAKPERQLSASSQR